MKKVDIWALAMIAPFSGSRVEGLKEALGEGPRGMTD